MTRLHLALAQYPIERLRGPEDFEAKLDDIVRAAKEEGTDLLVLPEYAAMELAAAFTDGGDAVSERDAIVTRAGSIVAVMQETARRHRIWLLGGTVPMLRDGAVRNRAPLISAEGQLVFQEKRVMTRFENEQWQVSAGEEPAVFDTPWGRIGIAICYDVEFPMLVRAQVEAGAWLILAPSCTDTVWGFNRVHLSARARAIENQCFVAITPTVGEAPWSATLDVNRGFAAVFGPCDRGFPEDGVITKGQMDAPGLVFAELDSTLLETVRQDGGVRNHRDWPAHPAGCSVATPQ
jgi:predicted amidohydrolase